MYSELAQRSMLDMILILVIIVSLLAIVWIFRRASESVLMATLETHQSEIQIKLREVRDEISNIEVVVNEPSNTSTTELNDSDKGIVQRLADFIKI
jgi:hypothetical protein